MKKDRKEVNETVEQAEAGQDETRRVEVATELKIRGAMLTMLGELLAEAKDPRSLYAVTQHIKAMLKTDRPLYHTAIMEADVEKLRQRGIKGMNAEYGMILDD